MESKIKKKTYTNKYQKYIVCSYGYKLVCPDDTFSKLFKKYLWIIPKSLFEHTSLSSNAMLKMAKFNLNLFHIVTCLYSLKEVQEVKLLTFKINVTNPPI